MKSAVSGPLFRKLSRQLTVHYSLVQAAYWCSHICIINFLALFLQSRAFNTSEIGIVIAIASILSISVQSFLGHLADRNPGINPHKITLFLAGAAMILVAAAWLIPMNKTVLALLYVALLCDIYTIQPFITAMGYTYINHGIQVNFGLARGIGSITCAGMSTILGSLIAASGPDISLPFFLLFFLLLSLLTISFVPRARHHGSGSRLGLPSPAAGAERGKSKQKTLQKSSPSLLHFFRTYRIFCLFLAGVAFLKAGNQTLVTYLNSIIENVGGNSAHLGRALAIAAMLELPTMAASGYLLRKVSSSLLLKLSAFFFVVKAVLTYTASSIGMVYFAQCFQMLSFALFIPVVTQYCNQLMADEDKVLGQAMLNVAMVSVANVIGNMGGGLILDLLGLNSIFLFAIGCTAAGFLIFCLTARKQPAG